MYDDDFENDDGSLGDMNRRRFDGRQSSATNNNRDAQRNNGPTPADARNNAACCSEAGYQPRCIAPNPDRRAENLRLAQEEADAYREYQQRNRPAYVSEVGTVGGGSVSLEEARLQMQRDTNNLKIKNPAMKDTWKEEKRKREEAEYEKKKMEARRQAERNEEREERKIEEQQRKYDESRRLANENFLSRLERGDRAESSQNPLLPPMGGDRAELPQGQCRPMGGDRAESHLSGPAASCQELGSRANRLPQQAATASSQPRQQPAEVQTFSQAAKLQQLFVLFPHIDMDILEDVMRSCDYDIERAADHLVSM